MKKHLFLIFLFLLMIMVAGTSEAAVHKLKIKISSLGTAVTNYPVRINVDAKTLIDAGLMQSDLRDVRFENEAGTYLPFWIHFTEGMQRNIKNIPIWVKLDTLPASGDKYIYMSFDPTRTKTNPVISPYTTGNFCGDHRTSPFTNQQCGRDVFGSPATSGNGMFAMDYAASTSYTYPSGGCWNWAAGTFGGDFVRSASPYSYFESSNSFGNSFLLHYRYHLNAKNAYNAYLLMATNTDPTKMESGTGSYQGYKIAFVSVTDVSTLQYSFNIKVYKRTTTGGSWTELSTGGGYTSGGYAWNPYRNSIQDFDVKVTSSTISIYNNGKHIGTITRSDSFSGGYAGFYSSDKTHGECDSYMTNTISPVWVINNYIGDPTITFMGNADLLIQRVTPTADGSSTGEDVIEDVAKIQLLEDRVDGNNLEKYVYTGYPLANPSNQIFKHALTIRNRGSASDTFNITMTPTSGSLANWFVQYDTGSGLTQNLPGTGGTNTSGQVTLAGGATQTIYVTVMPTISALFEGAYGWIKLDFKATSTSDSSFDNVRFQDTINGKFGCHWKKKLPITISYNDTNGTSDLLDYQVLVTLTSFDFSDARADGADVIFTDANGTALPFWQKNTTFNKGTSVSNSYWIKTNKIMSGAPGSTTIYMWWGNPSYSPTRSSKQATFDLWEDWESRTVGTRPGCPDGSTDGTYNCTGQPTDTVWTNNPDSGDPKNWWSIISGGLNGKSVQAASITSQDYGPILSGGDVRWKNYEAMYSLKKASTGTIATYSPVLFQDPGNQWGTEYFTGEYIYRPTSYGTDWTWVYQTSVSGLPAAGSKYVNKIRVFHNPNGTNHLQILITDAGATPTDGDLDTDFTTIADFYPDPAFAVDSGAIGFGGWDGGLTFDDIRVRKYTEPEPACSNGTTISTTYNPIVTLSMPVLTSPLLNGRPVLLTAKLKTYEWTGDLNAVYADCYIAGDCKTGEDQTHLGTISLWGNTDADTPTGFGNKLELSVAGNNNRASIDDSSWQSNGRYLFTAYDSDSDGKISCTTTAADCIAFGTTNASTLKNYFGVDSLGFSYPSEASPYTKTQNLVNFVRGKYVTGFARSDVKNMCTSGTADTCQWKMGDIAHSNPLVVAIPNMLYSDTAYSTFQSANNSRDMVVYFSSNEGVLHAVRMAKFNTTTNKYEVDSTATELWGFIPNAVLPLLNKTTDTYHEYTADGLLRAIDIKSSGAYKTVLIGGLRGGGQSLFALNVTDPRAPALMWEKNASTNATEFDKIGKSWSAPAVGRLCESEPCDATNTTNRWVAIIGSGFKPNDIDNLSKPAYLSIINLENGDIIKQIEVSTKKGNITTNIGVLRDRHGYLQKIYFGDYYGALWRVNLASTANVATLLHTTTPIKTILDDTDMLFEPSDYATSDISSSVLPTRPITSQPSIAYSKDSSGNDLWWTYFGTGEFDVYDSSYTNQRFYGLKDNVSSPYVDGDLVDMTYTTATNSTKDSWYLELGHTDSKDYQFSGTTSTTCVSTCESSGFSTDYCTSTCQEVAASTKNQNERLLSSPTIYGGFVFFSTYTPSSTPCSGGVARFYGLGYDTGSYNDSLLMLGNQTNARSLAISIGGGVPSTPLVYSGKSGSGQIVAAGLVDVSTSGLTKTNLNPEKFKLNLNLLLWRRIR